MTLSTHILDEARGVPAAGVKVALIFVVGENRIELANGTTNDDGRIVSPFGGELQQGEYELVFSVGPYYKATGKPSFYDDIPVRFLVNEARHYHVPLLLAPWGYSTYRGS